MSIPYFALVRALSSAGVCIAHLSSRYGAQADASVRAPWFVLISLRLFRFGLGGITLGDQGVALIDQVLDRLDTLTVESLRMLAFLAGQEGPVGVVFRRHLVELDQRGLVVGTESGLAGNARKQVIDVEVMRVIELLGVAFRMPPGMVAGNDLGVGVDVRDDDL